MNFISKHKVTLQRQAYRNMIHRFIKCGVAYMNNGNLKLQHSLLHEESCRFRNILNVGLLIVLQNICSSINKACKFMSSITRLGQL